MDLNHPLRPRFFNRRLAHESWASRGSSIPYEIEHDIIYSEHMVDDMYSGGYDSGYTELIRAVIQNRSAEHIDSVICGGENVNNQNCRDDDKTALHYAVCHRSCDLDVILTLLNRGADIEARSRRDRRTPLHFAVQNPYMKPEIIRTLLTSQGANVNVLSGSIRKFTPLHFALAGQNCKEEIIEVLLNHRADLTEVAGGLLPIHVALMNINCSMNVIRLLILTGSPISTMCSVGSPLFILLCRPDCDIAVVTLMLRNKADPNSDKYLVIPDPSFRTSLQLLRCSSVVNDIIEDFNPHILRKALYSHAKPLIAGLIHPNISANDYELLLKYGGNPNLIGQDTRTVLSVAVDSKKLDVPKLRVLLRYGAKFNGNSPWMTQLLFSSLLFDRGDLTLEVLKAFMDYKDNFGELKNRKGCNLLHYGFEVDAPPELLMLLMKYYCPPDQIGPCKSSTLHHAVSSNCSLHIIESLLEQSTSVDVKDKNCDTPLHLAGARPEVVKMLLRYGADATLLNSKQQTPFHVYFEFHDWSFQMLQNVIKAMVLYDYLASGYFDSKMFVENLCDPLPFGTEHKKVDLENLTMRIEEIKNDLIPFINDCQSELGYACILDPAYFYLLVSRFSLKLHLKKGLMKSKTTNKEERLLTIKEKMFQTLSDKKLLWIIASNDLPLYEDFLLMLLNKDELLAVASELKIPIKTKGSEEFEFATPVSIYLVAQYLTLGDLDNLILAFLKSEKSLVYII